MKLQVKSRVGSIGFVRNVFARDMLLCDSIVLGQDELEVTALRGGEGVSALVNSAAPASDQIICEISKKQPNRLQENQIEVTHRIIDGRFRPELRLQAFLDEVLYDKVFRLLFEMGLEAELLFKFDADRVDDCGLGLRSTIELKPEHVNKPKCKHLTELDIRIFTGQV